jgi:carboxyvinyl-carboxyphosphonate phosphorylmutase
MNEKTSTQLRGLLAAARIIVAPGAFDALSARLIEQAGFPAVYVTGAGVASSRLGVPDIGLTTMNEALDTAKNIVSATNIPVICDTDTGYGNAINLIRTVTEFERIGVAAIQIEDQITPKRCGHTEGKQLITKEEMVKKIEAFQYAKRSDLVLIARTDAIAVNGFDDAIDRARAYGQAGADVLFVESPRTIEEMKRIPEVLDVPLLVNMVEGGGKTPLLPVKELETMGFRIAIYPTSAWMAAIKAMQGVLKELKKKGSTDGYAAHMVSFQEMFEVVGLSQYEALEEKYLTLE